MAPGARPTSKPRMKIDLWSIFKVLPPTEIPTLCAMAFEIFGPI